MWKTLYCIVCVLFCLYVDIGYSKEDEPLRCFFCRGMGPDNECEMYKPYQDAMDAAEAGRDHDGPVFLKDCSAPFNKSCIIETFANDKGEIAHIRDCSDDKTFDFNEMSANISTYERLRNLQDNNETACTYDGKNMVCLSRCGPSENFTDFCNGPTLGGPRSNSFSVILLFTVSFFYLTVFVEKHF